jgi:NADH dehydrogenase
VAPAAKQQGVYAAKVIRAKLEGRAAAKPFRYVNVGNLATIGRSSAIADFGWLRVSGLLAWLLWGVVHIFFLIGFRNRLSILIEWIWAYLTFQRGARLITGPHP